MPEQQARASLSIRSRDQEGVRRRDYWRGRWGRYEERGWPAGGAAPVVSCPEDDGTTRTEAERCSKGKAKQAAERRGETDSRPPLRARFLGRGPREVMRAFLCGRWR